MGTLTKERTEFGAVISAGLLEASFLALNRDEGDPQLVSYLLLTPVALDAVLA